MKKYRKYEDCHRVVSGVKQKRCRKCSNWKNETEFGKDRSTTDGLYLYCKDCDSISAQKYYQVHQDKIKANTKAYYETHKVEHGTCAKKYYEAHKVQVAAYAKEFGQTVMAKKSHHKAQKRYSETIVGCLKGKYAGIKNRCNNPDHLTYKWYGGRGIQCLFENADEFVDYVTKVLKVDPRGLDIHRIDPDGHYEIGNIEFILPTEHTELHKRMGAWK